METMETMEWEGWIPPQIPEIARSLGISERMR